MARIPLPGPEQMNAAQRAVHDSVVRGPRGRMVGPLRAVIHSPELAARWSSLGEFLRYGTAIPARLKELAIIVTGRRWSSQVEWHVHADAAAAAGVPRAAIDALRAGAPPRLDAADDALVYDFTRELQLSGQVTQPTYDAVLARFGAAGIVELTAIIGYYTMVSLMLNAHEIPLPEGTAPPLVAPQDGSLAPLPQRA